MCRAIAVSLFAALAFAQPVRLTINTPIVTHTIDERIYGQPVTADIWGEAVKNPRFAETLAEGAWRVNNGVIECAGPEGHFRLPVPRDYELSVEFRGRTVLIGAFEFNLPDNNWHHVRLRADGPRSQAWLDRQPRAARGPSQPVLGVRGGAAEFRRLTVTTLDGQSFFSGIPLPAAHWYVTGAVDVTGHRLDTRDAYPTLVQHGISARAGDTLRGALRIRGLAQGVSIRLFDRDSVVAFQDLPAASEMPIVLSPMHNARDATLEIALPRGADLTLEQITLMPDSARATGGFRPDLLQALTALRPPILRWSAADWKTAAFGVDQFLALAGKLHSEPVISIAQDDEELIQRCAHRVKYFDRGGLTSEWTSDSALETGAALNHLERDPKTTMAMPAKPIPPGTPAYAVMKLYRDHFATDSVQLTADATVLDVVAARTPDASRIYVKLVNSQRAAIPVEVTLRGDFPLLDATMQLVTAAESPIEHSGLTARFTLPAESVAVVTLSR